MPMHPCCGVGLDSCGCMWQSVDSSSIFTSKACAAVTVVNVAYGTIATNSFAHDGMVTAAPPFSRVLVVPVPMLVAVAVNTPIVIFFFFLHFSMVLCYIRCLRILWLPELLLVICLVASLLLLETAVLLISLVLKYT